jgi:hypothetical protein
MTPQTDNRNHDYLAGRAMGARRPLSWTFLLKPTRSL